MAPDKARDPPCEEMLWLLVDYLCTNTWMPCHKNEVLTAAFAVLAWDCYLRPSEALMLRKEDLCPPRPRSSVQRWSVTIAPAVRDRPAKNRQFDAGVVVGAHERLWVEPIVKFLYDRCPTNGLIFDGLQLATVDDWAVAAYVDNYCAIAGSPELANAKVQQISAALRAKGLPILSLIHI